jgi:Zn-dependent metalloprotease
MQVFALHALDRAAAPVLAQLRKESESAPQFSLAGAAGVPQLDPETAAKGYLQQALASPSLPRFTAPSADSSPSDFRSLGTETVPLTGTRTVKFRQQFNRIPVYGSLVTVELDENNNLVSLNSSIAEPSGVSPVAKISPADALKSIDAYPGYRKQTRGKVPQLHYYFNVPTGKWHLAFIVEDVPVTSRKAGPEKPLMMDYIVDAQNGRVIAEVPATPTMAAVTESAVDSMGAARQITVDKVGTRRVLRDTLLNVQTFDFQFRDPVTEELSLPGREIRNPPKFSPAAVSAHANAAVVATYLRDVLKRNNIDNRGGVMKSTVNCVVEADRTRRDPPRQWLNAFWNGRQMVYGQRVNGRKIISLAANVDVVAHEMFHGVTDRTSGLEYRLQSGALNESYSDIFGVIISNLGNPDPRTWDWELGEGLLPGGRAFRDISDPARFRQPAHMDDFRVLPDTENGDFGGVHINSGIHNKVAHLMLTAEDQSNTLIFTPNDVAAVFYLALTQHLSRTSQFSDSRRAVLLAARTFFRTRPLAEQDEKLNAIERAFSDVGIEG